MDLRRDHLVDGSCSRPRTNVAKSIAPACEPRVGRDLDEDHVADNRRGALFETRDACVERDIGGDAPGRL